MEGKGLKKIQKHTHVAGVEYTRKVPKTTRGGLRYIKGFKGKGRDDLYDWVTWENFCPAHEICQSFGMYEDAISIR